MKTAIAHVVNTNNPDVEDLMRLFRFGKNKAFDPVSFLERVEFFLQLKAKNTQRSYRGVAREWIAFLDSRSINPLDATEREVFAYTSTMLQKPGEAARYSKDHPEPCTAATVGRKVVILREMYKEFPQFKFQTPFDNAQRQLRKAHSGEKRPTEAASAEQVRKLLGVTNANRLIETRDRAFIALLFGCGLRISEVINLRLRDIRPEGSILVLMLSKTKSGRPDEHAAQEWVAERVNALIDQRRLEEAEPQDFLIASYRGEKCFNRRMNAKTGYNIFKEIAKKTGVPETLSTHSGRATAVTQLLLEGLDYGSAMDFLRHKSMTMVHRYDKRLRTRTNHPGLRLDYSKSA